MIRITNGELRLGGKTIFPQLSWRVDIGKRVGLVGPNGAGKTSLLRVLIGEYTLESGTRECSKNLTLGYLPQDQVEMPQQKVSELLMNAFISLNRMETDMQALLHSMKTLDAASAEHERALHRYSELQEQFQQAGGYRRETDAKKILVGLGFQPGDWERPIAEFSGGWRMRVLLSKLLLENPDILLLDEPSNHLDPEALAWFENYLMNSKAGLVIVSHDRYFLDRVVTEIAEIERGKLTTFSGNYSRYVKQKAAMREQLIAQKKQQDREIVHLETFIERFRAKNTKATQAQSRMKRLDKIERIEIASDAATVTIPLPETPRSGKEVLILEGIGHCYGEQRALHPADLVVHRGERIAVWGPNGAGKSTLLSIMAGDLIPTEGTITWGHNAHKAFFSQHHAELQTSQRSVLDELSAVAPAEMQSRLRDVLAPFLFRGEDVFKCVSVLSGGEKSRLALAKLLIRPINVLILDEPLNHLDLSTVETLERTLQQFIGAIIFVSHDRFFIDRLATQVWEMDHGHLRFYIGSFSDYEYAKRYLAQQSGDALNTPSVEENIENPARQIRKDQRRLEAEERNRRNRQLREQKQKCETVEREIHEVEKEISDIETKMSSNGTINYSNEMPKLAKRYKTLQKIRERLYGDWDKLVESMESK